ncbi:MAG: hypothetical protein IT290_00330 [Deltaproteobacteria bacterium]|nr:hypothetical protein [Deltaproteobacteria bacterium]
MKRSAYAFLALTIATTGFGCSGGDDDDDFGGGGVTRVRIDDRTLSVGEGTVVAVDFEFDRQDIFIDDDNVVVVVRLPGQLRYRDDTSEIDGVGSDDGVGARVTECAGETYLEYDLDRFDLDDAANPDGSADARLTLTVDAVSPGASVEIEAVAEENGVPYSCGAAFLSDESEFVSVVD